MLNAAEHKASVLRVLQFATDSDKPSKVLEEVSAQETTQLLSIWKCLRPSFRAALLRRLETRLPELSTEPMTALID
jgi:hypothetical protein